MPENFKREKDISGERYGMVVALYRDTDSKTKSPKWVCVCDCGVVKSFIKAKLKKVYSCGCTRRPAKNIKRIKCGDIFGRLTVTAKTAERARRDIIWICECSCGTVINVPTSYLNSGDTKSCGCLKTDVGGRATITHGLSSHPAYHSFKGAHDRCYNPNNRFYENYGGRGIVVGEDFKDNITAWCNYLGYPPDQENNWTVDRIDPNGNYTAGNIRWATRKEQAQNHNISSANNTGVTGVCISFINGEKINVIASWTESDGTQRARKFSIRKYGYEEAFRLACEEREKAINNLINNGECYTKYHGQSKKQKDSKDT